MNHSKRLFAVVVVLLTLAATVLGASAQAVNPGQGSTDVRVMNLTSDAAAPAVGVTAEYYNQTGVVEATKNANLASLGTYDFLAADSGLFDGWKGSMVVSSTGEVAALGTTTYTGGSAPASVGSYRGFDEGATTIYFPQLQQRPAEYSVIAVQNADSGSADIAIYYYSRDGTPYGANPITDSIPASAQRTYDLSQKGIGKIPDLGITVPPSDGWIGSAKVVSTNGKKLVGAAVVFQPAYSTAYPASLTGADTLYFAAISRRCYAPCSTQTSSEWLQWSGVVVQNLSETTTANIHVYVTDRFGSALYDFTTQVPALSARGFNTRFLADTPDPAAFYAALGSDFNGGMYITSDQPLVGLSDMQVLVPGSNGRLTYLGEGTGGTSVFAPQVYRINCVGITCEKSTSVIVLNPDPTNSAAVTVRFIDTNGTIKAQFGATIPPRTRNGYNTRVKADFPGTDAEYEALKTTLGNAFKGSVWITSDRPVIGVGQHFVTNESDAYNVYTK
jgi:hypothetical protein